MSAAGDIEVDTMFLEKPAVLLGNTRLPIDADEKVVDAPRMLRSKKIAWAGREKYSSEPAACMASDEPSLDDFGMEDALKSAVVKNLAGVAKPCTIGKLCKERDFPAQQLCGVIRHTERADGADAMGEGESWHCTEDMHKWPLDPPLSDHGVAAAKTLGQRVLHLTKEAAGTEVHVIVSSPYLRCIQTALEVCVALGPDTRLLVDRSLGEIYGPMAMGLMEPNPECTVHPAEYILDLCSKRGVACEPQYVGESPIWPESLRAARRRFAGRFLTYLRRSLRVRRNFLIVSHADCVGAAHSMMPSEVGFVLDQVKYGGMFLAQRQFNSGCISPRRRSCPAILKLSPGADSAKTHEQCEQGCESDSPCSTRAESKASDPSVASVQEQCKQGVESEPLRSPSPLAHQYSPRSVLGDGWQVKCYDLKRGRAQEGEQVPLERRLSELASDSSFSHRLIEQLLVMQLSDLPLNRDAIGCGGCVKAPLQELSLEDNASLSNSTVVFGASCNAESASLTALSRRSSLEPFSPTSMRISTPTNAPVTLLGNINSRIATRRRLSGKKNPLLFASSPP